MHGPPRAADPLRLPEPTRRPTRRRCDGRAGQRRGRPLWFGSQRTKIWRTPFGVDLVVPERFDVVDLPDGSSVVRNPQGIVYAKRAAGAYYHDPAGAPLAAVGSPGKFDDFDRLFERWDFSYVYDEPLEDLARVRKGSMNRPTGRW